MEYRSRCSSSSEDDVDFALDFMRQKQYNSFASDDNDGNSKV